MNLALLALLYYFISRDLHQRQQAQEKLQQSEQRFRATFEQAAMGITHVALDGKWLS
ncbi:MAG: hypothetical protein KME21_07490 [Desmonostoc vinosum HA7617-LM4]|nr:hypothetical protein [Desmonostoc vinosum HA7617-LM4]